MFLINSHDSGVMSNNGMGGDLRVEGYRNFSKDCRKKIRKLIDKNKTETGLNGEELMKFLNEKYTVSGTHIWPRSQEKPQTIYASSVKIS